MNTARVVLLVSVAVGWYLLQGLSIMNDAPPASPDAAVFADAARNLAATGRPGTSLVVDMTNHVYWQPPGYLLALAGTFKLFGCGLWQLRLLSLLFGAGCIWLVYDVSLKVHADRASALLAVLLLSFDPLFSKWARWDRMDTLCVFFVLLSFSMYLVAIEKNQRRFLVAGGTAASAAMMIHPYGALALAAIVLHALVARKLSGMDALALFSPLVIFIAGWALYVAQAPAEFLEQMRYQVERKFHHSISSLPGLLSQYRFFPMSCVAFAGALVFAFLSRNKPFESRSLLIVVAVFLVIFSFVLVKGPYYHTYLAPILVIGASAALVNGLRLDQQAIRRMLMSLLVLFVLNGLVYAGALAWLYRLHLGREANHTVLVSRILECLPADAKFGHFGYPTPYWVLNAIGESSRMREMYFLRPGKEADVFEGLDDLVFTQSSTPLADNQATRQDIDFAEAVLGRSGKHLRFVAFVGVDAPNAYRALIYSIEGGYTYAGIPVTPPIVPDLHTQ